MHTRSILTLLVMALVLPFMARAQTPDKKRAEKAEYQLHLDKLRRENPAVYAAELEFYSMQTKLFLGRLGYAVGENLATWDKTSEASLRQYEARRHIPATGNPMSFETRNKVASDTVTLDREPLSLPGRHIFLEFWDQGFVSAVGTWIIRGESMAMPEQTSKLQCDRSTGKCVEATTTISRFVGIGMSLSVDVYEIERWDKHEIVTKPLEFGCVRYVKRFNRAQGSLTGTRSSIQANDEACKALDNEEKNLQLADGWEISTQLHKRRFQEKEAIESPEVKRVVTRWADAMKR